MRKSGLIRQNASLIFMFRGKTTMENTNQFLGTERVGKLMRRYAVPCIISLLVGALYNIVDQIFIANASYLGSYGNAANTVVFPLTVVALAIAVMIGDGCCAFVSISLGKGEVGEARKSVGSAVVLSIASGLVLTALYLIFADAIISMFGGTVNEETFHYAQEYFFYISLGIPFYMFGQAMNPVIRADGDPRFAMISTLAGATIPLSMLIIGTSLGAISVRAALADWRVYVVSAVRLLVCPLLTWLVLRPFVSGALLGIPVLLAACPSAMVVTALCLQYDRSDAFASKCIFLNTILSAVTIPLLIWLLF